MRTVVGPLLPTLSVRGLMSRSDRTAEDIAMDVGSAVRDAGLRDHRYYPLRPDELFALKNRIGALLGEGIAEIETEKPDVPCPERVRKADLAVPVGEPSETQDVAAGPVLGGQDHLPPESPGVTAYEVRVVAVGEYEGHRAAAGGLQLGPYGTVEVRDEDVRPDTGVHDPAACGPCGDERSPGAETADVIFQTGLCAENGGHGAHKRDDAVLVIQVGTEGARFEDPLLHPVGGRVHAEIGTDVQIDGFPLGGAHRSPPSSARETLLLRTMPWTASESTNNMNPTKSSIAMGYVPAV